ncbi:MAG: hypothetical protein O3B37_06635 [Proteobacteria bacterium]|nr:hypothetical protein [Pseudomonadota bacterium]
MIFEILPPVINVLVLVLPWLIWLEWDWYLATRELKSKGLPINFKNLLKVKQGHNWVFLVAQILWALFLFAPIVGAS